MFYDIIFFGIGGILSGGDWKDLYSGCVRGDLSLVQYHIKNGIDPNYQHPEILCSPLVTAILNGHSEIALYLLNAKADPTLRSFFDNMTPLEAAIQSKDLVVLQRLSELGVQPASSLKKRFFSLFKKFF